MRSASCNPQLTNPINANISTIAVLAFNAANPIIRGTIKAGPRAAGEMRLAPPRHGRRRRSWKAINMPSTLRDSIRLHVMRLQKCN
ncbi:hypothetical protein ACLKA7_002917 [Drosophila subpalustris]